ncbi:hypothetical protein BABINDRAFT_35915 [Babjeviella inositovora NRRL Y-12698]|uniref:Ketoreductase (KR) domain-containing protein n=1 Tax=Babjeviella inositovora NRRL Y-12698 TaxID=984486 RepID=A0A1E3QRE1_9ASCO|nr:uncharacterized protein BABINDRAFT_35915 [Babjeviella inositovora NRRL Y-12698]ODQ80208.1 hypothetical protein BABINDRAFT_35915 [Babjeviella inositovora NRRL Y-12698]
MLLGLSDYAQMARNFFPPAPALLPEDYPSLAGKVVIVTGGNSGVGFETVKLLGAAGAKVYIFARNEASALQAIEDAKKTVKDIDVHFVKADLSDLTTIKPAAEAFLARESRLDLVIHNAGVMVPPVGSTSAQGYELQLGTNVIGPFALQKLLTPVMYETVEKFSTANESRIVWVTSSAHGISPKHGVNLDNLNDLTADVWANYGQSKAAMIIAAAQWAKQNPKEASKIVTISVDPGNLKTNLQRNMSWFSGKLTQYTFHPAIYGAYSELFGALSPTITTANNGGYIIPWGRVGRIRGDVAESANNEIGEKFYKYLEDETAKYL